MMKKIAFLFLAILTFSVAMAQESSSKPAASLPLAEQGDSAYSKDNYVEAERLYLLAIKTDGTSPEIFYNLGNAYYRQGNLGKAIVNYERALKLDPAYSDARDNLEFVKSKITDKQIDSGSIMTDLWDSIVGCFKADTWAWIALVLFAVFIGSIAVYVFSSGVAVRKISFFGGLVVLLFTAVSVTVAFASADRLVSNDHAIILSPSAQLATSPREARSKSEEAFLLHEGTKVEILDSIANPGEGVWYEVRVGARERAWIKAGEVERI